MNCQIIWENLTKFLRRQLFLQKIHKSNSVVKIKTVGKIGTDPGEPGHFSPAEKKKPAKWGKQKTGKLYTEKSYSELRESLKSRTGQRKLRIGEHAFGRYPDSVFVQIDREGREGRKAVRE
jgi:hypothetical protein